MKFTLENITKAYTELFKGQLVEFVDDNHNTIKGIIDEINLIADWECNIFFSIKLSTGDWYECWDFILPQIEEIKDIAK